MGHELHVAPVALQDMQIASAPHPSFLVHAESATATETVLSAPRTQGSYPPWPGAFVELWSQSCVDLIMRYDLDNLLTCHTFMCHRVLFFILSNSYLHLVLESLACIFTLCISYGMLAFIDPMHRENSTIILNWLRCT
jgi:hypothetical protein